MRAAALGEALVAVLVLLVALGVVLVVGVGRAGAARGVVLVL